MKPKVFLKCALSAFVAMLLSAACSSPRQLVFADRDWHISNYYGQIIDKDTTYRMTFGNIIIPEELVVVSSADSLVKYPGMDKFLSDILHSAHLDNAEILFYAPEMHVLFAIPHGDMPRLRPSSITVEMLEEHPYTMWFHEEDVEKWIRKPEEMYTYTYFDKRKSRLLVVDLYDYGDVPLAQISIFQSRNKVTDKMKVPFFFHVPYFKNLLKKSKQQPYIQVLAHMVEMCRKHAIDNYRIGQEQKDRIK